MHKTLAIALGCALGAMAAPAAAAIINIGTSAQMNLPVELEAGTWQITALGADADIGSLYDGYSVWNRQSGCDAQGQNCAQGWRWAYRLADGNGSTVSSFNTTSVAGNTLDAARALGIAQREGPFTFTLDQAQTLYFTFTDSNFSDNRGGVSLDLSLAPTAVPVPATALLMGLGLLVMSRRLRAAD